MSNLEWLSLTGVLIEILGLIVLFVDLMDTKDSEEDAEEFRFLQDSLANETRDMLLTMNSSVKSMAKAVRSIGQLEDLETDVRGGDESIAIRKGLVEVFRANMGSYFEKLLQDLPNDKKLEEARLRNEDIGRRIAKRFNKRAADSRKMRKVAQAGIGLVLLGVSMQLIGSYENAFNTMFEEICVLIMAT